VTAACWADPLSRTERRVLAEKLARACKRLYHNRNFPLPSHVRGESCMADARRAGSYISASAEMSDLHLDVTERAEVATS
jgi:hypothetical protein